MKKRYIRLLLVLVSLVLIPLVKIETQAQNYVNEPVTVTLSQSWSTPAAGFYSVSINNEYVSVGDGLVGNPITGNYVTSFSIPVTFTPSSTGSYTISITFDVSDGNAVFIPVNAVSQTIEVTTRPTTPDPDPTPVTPTLSNNYYLNSLSVSPGSLNPAFSTANDVYYVNLEEGTTTYSINASVADPSAVILSGVGSFAVPRQEFLHRVVIQAENGLMWEYHINFSLPDDRSDNNNLGSLSVSNGRLTPAFDADVLNYTVEVARGVSSVSITATTQDDTATVTGTGEVELSEEEDTIVDVVVTAENNQAKIYKITFRVATMPEQSITTEGVTYTFDYDIPEGIEKIGFTPQTDLTGFEEGTPYFENKSKTLRAIYLNDGEASNWYLLKEDNQVGQKLVLIEINDKFYGYIGLEDEVLEQPQMKPAKIKLGEIEIDGWSFNNNTLEDYLMLYVIDESGDPDYYLYQVSEALMLKIGDFRLLDPSLIEVEPQEEIKEDTPSKRNLDVQSILFLIISLLAIVGLVIVVYFIRRNRKSNY